MQDKFNEKSEQDYRLSEKENMLYNRLLTLFEIDIQDYNRNIRGLSPEQITEVCARAWDIPTQNILSKVRHNDQVDRFQKVSFLSAAVLFSNISLNEIAELLPCTGSFVRHAIENMHRLIYRHEANRKIFMQIISELDRRCPGRLKNLYRVSWDSYRNYRSEWSHPLYPYQIGKIEIRDYDWFKKNKSESILSYSLDGNEAYYLNMKGSPEHSCLDDLKVLFLIQQEGYRFILTDDLKTYKKYHPMCDRCMLKNACMWVGRPSDALRIGLGKECFKELPDNPLRVDIDLLMPLPTYMLQ